MKRSEAIGNLLRARTHADLASLYTPAMEVQVNVAQGNGERIDSDYKGRWSSWTDGISKWYPFRIPKDAKSEPKDNDYEINFDLAEHAEGIGMTGWNWQLKESFWVGFDFDAIVGHSDKHEQKLSSEELQQVEDIVSQIPWVTIRRSTSGNGLHLYVFLKPVRTDNHTEHAAVARSILGLMASITGFDFQAKVDAVGGNLWVYHRKMVGTNGLSLVKQGGVLEEIPSNWREHLRVVSNRSKRVVPAFIENSKLEDIFDEIVAQKTKVRLDEQHLGLIKYLNDKQLHSWWDSDNWMLVTHTQHLLAAHKDLNYKGLFETNSPGSDLNTQNCFCFPMRNGAWVVRRYTPGIAEAPSWSQDNSGFTRTYLNRELDIKTAARIYGGVEHKSGGFVFQQAEQAVKAAAAINIDLKIPETILNRTIKVKPHKEGKLLFEITAFKTDAPDLLKGWIQEKNSWTTIFETIPQTNNPSEGNVCDELVRHLITEANEDAGWMINTEHRWNNEPLVHVRAYLKSIGLKATEIEATIGGSIAKPWKLVCRPFEPEILGDRCWNIRSPQLAYKPSDSDTLSYPHWLRILNHCGKSLDYAIKENAWCKASGILTGADYLKCWIASVFKEPTQPLPYLFFHGPQNSGKSIFHESLKLLVTSGVVSASTALINQSGFNGELENAVIAHIEEINLAANRTAYNRIKEWVTARYLPIHKKNATPYSVRNTVHFVQAANDVKYCPIFAGDTRITMIALDAIPKDQEIPKKELEVLLSKEAPDFLAAILQTELPRSNDRLNLPIITTSEKTVAENASRDYLEVFLSEYCHYVSGEAVLFSDFYDKFIEWLDADQVKRWSKIRVGRELPNPYVKGRSCYDNKVMIGNMSWTPKESTQRRYILEPGTERLIQE